METRLPNFCYLPLEMLFRVKYNAWFSKVKQKRMHILNALKTIFFLYGGHLVVVPCRYVVSFQHLKKYCIQKYLSKFLSRKYILGKIILKWFQYWLVFLYPYLGYTLMLWVFLIIIIISSLSWFLSVQLLICLKSSPLSSKSWGQNFYYLNNYLPLML